MDSKQEGRPLPVYFPPSNCAKDTFQKWKQFVEKTLSSANFDHFSKFRIFMISAENPQFRWKQYFFEIISLDTQSAANLPPLPILKKVQVFEKPNAFFRKTQTSYILRSLTISVAF